MEAWDIVRAVAALGVTLGIALVASWAARRFDWGRLLRGPGGAGPVRRLRIVEQLALDPRRRLVLIRRDDEEHLILLGPGGDVALPVGSARPIEGGAP